MSLLCALRIASQGCNDLAISAGVPFARRALLITHCGLAGLEVKEDVAAQAMEVHMGSQPAAASVLLSIK